MKEIQFLLPSYYTFPASFFGNHSFFFCVGEYSRHGAFFFFGQPRHNANTSRMSYMNKLLSLIILHMTKRKISKVKTSLEFLQSTKKRSYDSMKSSNSINSVETDAFIFLFCFWLAKFEPELFRL